MVLDPLLLSGFIYICPKEELPKLIPEVEPFVSVSYLAKLFRDTRTLNYDEVPTNLDRQ